MLCPSTNHVHHRNKCAHLCLQSIVPNLRTRLACRNELHSPQFSGCTTVLPLNSWTHQMMISNPNKHHFSHSFIQLNLMDTWKVDCTGLESNKTWYDSSANAPFASIRPPNPTISQCMDTSCPVPCRNQTAPLLGQLGLLLDLFRSSLNQFQCTSLFCL
jgi:hypothetical protein